MKEKKQFLRLEVLVNGESLCVAGLETGITTVEISWRQGVRTQFRLAVRGLEPPTKEAPMLWFWEFDRPLTKDDEVVVRVLGPGRVSKPKLGSPVDPGPGRDASSAFAVA